jgi:hypothetical protein
MLASYLGMFLTLTFGNVFRNMRIASTTICDASCIVRLVKSQKSWEECMESLSRAIAFAGPEDEYEVAPTWIKDVCKRTGLPRRGGPDDQWQS